MLSLGNHGADKQLSKGFCPVIGQNPLLSTVLQRTKYISKYRQWKFESLKQLLCFYWNLGYSKFIGYKKKQKQNIYSDYNQHATFSAVRAEKN